MFYLIYTSTILDHTSEVELYDILESSIRNNTEKDITGLLIYNDGMFIQMLEGGREEVNSIYRKILDDKRHYNITTLLSGETSKRHFPHWRMALEVTHEKTFRQLEAFESLQEANDFLEGMHDDDASIRLLRYFYKVKSVQ